MENIITLNSGKKIEILMQDEVTLDIDCSLHYIESGKKEVEDYVENISKSRLDAIVAQAQTEMEKQIETGILEAQEKASLSAKEVIDDNIALMKDEINQYVEAEVKPYVDSAQTETQQSAQIATNAANLAEESYNKLSASLELASEVAGGNIGDIKYTLRNTAPYGGAFCNGQILTQEQYPDLYQMLIDNRLVHISSDEYAAQISENGSCFSFSIDETNKTIKVPTIPQATDSKYKAYVVCYTGKDIEIDIVQEIQLNNPFSLLEYKWSEFEITNNSWLLSNGVFHSGLVYVSAYELLQNIRNKTETKEGISVKLSTENYSDTDFVLNTEETSFRLPVKVKRNFYKDMAPVLGNGMTLGLNVKGEEKWGMIVAVNGGAETLDINSDSYGKLTTDTYTSQTQINNTGNVGITTDPLKSGIEAHFKQASDLYLYFYVGETIQDASLINAGGVIGALSKKVGFNDKHVVIGWNMPDWSAVIEQAINTTHTAISDGYIFGWMNQTDNGGVYLTINGVDVASQKKLTDNTFFIPLTAGDVYKLTDASTAESAIKFMPMKGAN